MPEFYLNHGCLLENLCSRIQNILGNLYFFGPGNDTDAIFLQIHTSLVWCEVMFSNSLQIGYNAYFRLIGLKSSVDNL